jgi:hypothetical protein
MRFWLSPVSPAPPIWTHALPHHFIPPLPSPLNLRSGVRSPACRARSPKSPANPSPSPSLLLATLAPPPLRASRPPRASHSDLAAVSWGLAGACFSCPRMASDGAASRLPPLAQPPKRRAAGDPLQPDLLTYKRRRRATSANASGGSAITSRPDKVRIPLLALGGSSFPPRFFFLCYWVDLAEHLPSSGVPSARQDFVSTLQYAARFRFPDSLFHVAMFCLG